MKPEGVTSVAGSRTAVKLAVAGAAGGLLAACTTVNSTTSGQNSSGTDASKQVVIGLSNQTMAVTFPVGLAKGAQQEADRLGAKLGVLDAKGGGQKQGRH